MLFANSRLIASLRAEIERLRLKLARVEGERDSFREMAKDAIQVAREKHFKGVRYNVEKVDEENVIARGYLSDYVAPKVKHCPKCVVCVRSDSWPAKCKNCGLWFGDELDAEVIGDTEGPP